MKNVYLLKNNLTKTYSDPIFRFEKPEDMFRSHHNFMLLYPEKAKEQMLNISTIVWIGTYDDAKGIIEQCEVEDRVEYNLGDSWKQIEALKQEVKA